jgi:pimeloyl-ACP methyl ester carboxylesterase
VDELEIRGTDQTERATTNVEDLERITNRFVETGGIRMHIAEAGSGPLVVLLHGFPEFWYSWRHQLVALAESGFHAVAPDQRGFSRTDRPEEVERYTMLHLVGDVVGLLDALGEEQAVVAGHDWGAPVAWNAALMRPDRIRGAIALSIPYRPRGSAPPLATLRARLGDRFYMVYVQSPRVADAELARDVAATFRRWLAGASSDMKLMVVPEGGDLNDLWPEPDELPGWLSQEDLEMFVAAYEESGFTGGLNWYRNLDRNWELTAPWHHAPVDVPALFIAGERELDYPGIRKGVENLPNVVRELRRIVLLSKTGHWVQQERPAEVNAAMLGFLDSLPDASGSIRSLLGPMRSGLGGRASTPPVGAHLRSAATKIHRAPGPRPIPRVVVEQPATPIVGTCLQAIPGAVDPRGGHEGQDSLDEGARRPLRRGSERERSRDPHHDRMPAGDGVDRTAGDALGGGSLCAHEVPERLAQSQELPVLRATEPGRPALLSLPCARVRR